MPKIKHLPTQVVEMIAAGEVAERPAVIVKELIENAIDAAATSISIELTKAGLEKIKITDNGVGIEPTDIPLAYLRHTTSKIRSLDDLYQLTSYGFRGEALASIAQVGQLTLRSRTLDQPHGWQVMVNRDQATEPTPIGMAQGTTLIVTHLFETLPVRKKFLGNLSTELRHITQVVLTEALVHPKIAFTLIHDGTTLLKVTSQTEWLERVTSLLAIADTSLCVPINQTDDLFSCEVLLVRPN